MVLCHCDLNCLWDTIGVYGFSQVFLDELSLKISSSLHVLVGGDFILMHSPASKNNANFSWSRANSFNDFNQ